MATLYTDIATNQRQGYNNSGGGPAPTTGSYNDPVFELGSINEVVAVYTMTGDEVQNDIINITRLMPGQVVDPVYSNVAGNGAGTTCSTQIGDTDTVGGTVSADQTRYSDAIDVKADMTATTSVKFAGGTVLIVPAAVTDAPTAVDGPVWMTAKLSTLSTPVAGKKLVFRVRIGAVQ